MTNQTFKEKLGAEILAYGARAAMQNGRGSTTPAQDYRDAVQAIIKLIEEEVIGDDEEVIYESFKTQTGEVITGTDDIVTPQLNYLRECQRKIIKGEK